MKKQDTRINLILLAAVLFCSLPLVIHGIEGHFGQDLGFHLNRIEGIYLELSRGVFPVRLQSFWMEGYGYPVSIYYGDIFLYLPALLRLIGVPVVEAYKLFLFLVNLATVLVAYYSFSGIMGDRLLGAIGAFVYATSNYRLLDLYIRAAVGEYTALVFLPLVVYGVCLLYGWTADTSKKEPAAEASRTGPAKSGKLWAGSGLCTEAIAPLVTGMSGILLSHMMTLEITGICLIVVCVINIKKTFSPGVFLTYLVSVVATLLITLFFSVPFVDYFLTENVRINEVVGNARQIQESGTRLYEFFDFFMIPFSNLDPSVSDDRMLTTPGMVLMGTFLVGLAEWLYSLIKRESGGQRLRIIKTLTAAALILLFVSSDMFPWNSLGRSGAIGDLLAQVQFPWRYTGIATVVLTLLLLVLLDGVNGKRERLSFGIEKPKISAARDRAGTSYIASVFMILSVAAAMCVWFTGVYFRYAELDTFKTTADLDTYDMGFIEYLRPDAVREDFTHEIRVTAGEAEEVVELDRDGTAMDLYVRSKDGATIELPVLRYKYYQLTDDTGKSYELSDGKNDEISFYVDADFDGVLYLRYVPPMLWRIAESVSLAFVLILLGGWLFFVL